MMESYPRDENPGSFESLQPVLPEIEWNLVGALALQTDLTDVPPSQDKIDPTEQPVINTNEVSENLQTLLERFANERLLTPHEVAEMFRVNPKTVSRWAKKGILPCVRTLGGHRRYRVEDIATAMNTVNTH